MELNLLFTIFVSTIILLFSIKYDRKLIDRIGIFSITAEFVVSAIIIGKFFKQGFFVSNYFELNSFSILIFSLTILIGLMSTLYAVGYLRGEFNKGNIKIGQYWQTFFFLQLFILSMIVAITTMYPLVLWISIEASTLSTVFIINFFHKSKDLEVSWKYLIINTTGLLLALLGTFIFSAIPGNANQLTWRLLSQHINNLDPIIIRFAFIFIFIGYGTKMGIVPMHTWKPDAYDKGPIPITALLSTVLMNLSLYAILQYRSIVNSVIDPNFTKSLFIFFGTLSVIIGALSVFTQRNYRRLLSYSSIENGGLMLLSFGLGGIATLAGIMQMFYHTLSKSLLFFVAGNTGLKYGSSITKDVGGMLKLLPVTSILFIGAVLSIVGIPPFGIFISEFYILLSLFNSNYLIGFIVLFSLILTFIGFIKMIFSMVYLDNNNKEIVKGESSLWTTIPSILLFILILISGFYIPNLLKTLFDQSVLLLI